MYLPLQIVQQMEHSSIYMNVLSVLPKGTTYLNVGFTLVDTDKEENYNYTIVRIDYMAFPIAVTDQGEFIPLHQLQTHVLEIIFDIMFASLN